MAKCGCICSCCSAGACPGLGGANVAAQQTTSDDARRERPACPPWLFDRVAAARQKCEAEVQFRRERVEGLLELQRLLLQSPELARVLELLELLKTF